MNKPRFVWHDLNTKNVDNAKRFYGELFNWKFEGDANYLHIKSGDEMIGGVRGMDANERMPAHWMGYVGVEDVAATVETMTKNGGKVHMPTTSLPNVGTFAVVADPTGGVLAPWKSARAGEDQEPAGRPGYLNFCWDELLTSDTAAAEKFYTTVFGWSAEKMDMGPAGTYTVFKRPGIKDTDGSDKRAGGMMKSMPDAPHPPFWLAYVAVPGADDTVAKAKRLGATVMVEPTDIPNIGRFAVLMDAEHAAFAILQPAM